MTRSPRQPMTALAILLGVLALDGCAAPSRPKPSAAATATCRARAEQVFNRQNRDLLSYRDDSSTPFSSSYDSGITTAGLSRRFEHDQMMSSCLDASGSPAGVGSSFSPDAGGTTVQTRP